MLPCCMKPMRLPDSLLPMKMRKTCAQQWLIHHCWVWPVICWATWILSSMDRFNVRFNEECSLNEIWDYAVKLLVAFGNTGFTTWDLKTRRVSRMWCEFRLSGRNYVLNLCWLVKVAVLERLHCWQPMLATSCSCKDLLMHRASNKGNSVRVIANLRIAIR